MNYEVYTFKKTISPSLPSEYGDFHKCLQKIHHLFDKMIIATHGSHWDAERLNSEMDTNQEFKVLFTRIIQNWIETTENNEVTSITAIKHYTYKFVNFEFVKFNNYSNADETKIKITFHSSPVTFLRQIDNFFLAVEGDKSVEIKTGIEVTDTFITTLNLNVVHSFRPIIL